MTDNKQSEKLRGWWEEAAVPKLVQQVSEKKQRLPLLSFAPIRPGSINPHTPSLEPPVGDPWSEYWACVATLARTSAEDSPKQLSRLKGQNIHRLKAENKLIKCRFYMLIEGFSQLLFVSFSFDRLFKTLQGSVRLYVFRAGRHWANRLVFFYGILRSCLAPAGFCFSHRLREMWVGANSYV